MVSNVIIDIRNSDSVKPEYTWLATSISKRKDPIYGILKIKVCKWA